MNQPIGEQITAGKVGREVQTDEAVKIFLPTRVGESRRASTRESPWVLDDCGTGFVSGRVSCRHVGNICWGLILLFLQVFQPVRIDDRPRQIFKLVQGFHHKPPSELGNLSAKPAPQLAGNSYPKSRGAPQSKRGL
jgi:hypothetical protein